MNLVVAVVLQHEPVSPPSPACATMAVCSLQSCAI
jgi:hypothetical protein